ncbi:hypothetical protein [Candidatus Thiodiazotropha sp. CDECU1]|uniref:hypothetical protein n=1 Tax=Candidatus Thiodiazotropha sp. CDECU1 TaxID=3065865 RepID=UPI0029317906|nr:hypothetical protein [Candidatus Thiodiazotropha sp. CDECU1]
MRKNSKISDFHITAQLLWCFLWLPIAGLAEPINTLGESLRDSLLQQGWQEYTAADGSVIYRQPKKEAATDIQSVVTEASDMRKFGDALRGRGWQVKWDADNTLILIPETAKAISETTQKPPRPSTSDPLETPDELPRDLTGFDYWHIERDQQGALLFRPVDLTTQKQQSADAGYDRQMDCRIDHFQLTAGSLPVDQWSEAQDIAKQWLSNSGTEGLQVGRIRKINRIYLISIVEESAPYSLRHQLAVRVSDAAVVLIE